MTDDLRLRTARALGWEPAWQREEDGLLQEGWRYKDGRHGGGGMVIYGLPGRDVMECLGIPAYGASWACCEEIDVRIKELGWEYEVYISSYRTTVTIWKPNPTPTIESEMVVAGGGGAPTFPAAICLAFCEAVEASGE